MGLRDQLSSLNRQYRPIEITSADGESSVTVYYRRPAAAEDKVIQDSFNAEYKVQRERLYAPDGDQPSYHDKAQTLLLEEKPESTINILLNSQVLGIYRAAAAELEVEWFTDSATKAEKDAFFERLKPKFEEMLDKRKADLEEYPTDILVRRAVENKIDAIATSLANDILTRRSVAQSVYSQNDDGEYERVWANADEVSADLDSDTITSIVRKINAEVARSRTAPLTSAATK